MHAEDVEEQSTPGDGDSGEHLPPRFRRTVAWNYSATAIAAVVSIIATPVLIHHLGPSAFGVWAIAGSITTNLELFKFGLGTSSTRLVAYDAHRDPVAASRTLSNSLAVLGLIGLATAPIVFVIAINSPSWFSVPSDLTTATVLTVLISGLTFAISMPFDALSGALNAYQRYDLTAMLMILLVAGSTALGVVVVIENGGLLGLALATSTVALAVHPLRWIMLRRAAPELRPNLRYVERSQLRRIGALSSWMFIAQIANAMAYRFDTVITGQALGTAAVTVFIVGSRLSILSGRAVTQLSGAMGPRAAALRGLGDDTGMRRLLYSGTRVTLLAGVPLALVMIVLAHPIVQVWVGPGYDAGARVLVLYSMFGVLGAFMAASENMVLGAGNMRVYALAFIGTAVLNLAVSVVMVRVVGVEGAAIGTLVASLVLVPMIVVQSCRLSSARARSLVRATVVPHLFPAVLSIGVMFALRPYAFHLVTLLPIVAVSVGSYLAAFWFVTAGSDDRRAIRELVLGHA